MLKKACLPTTQHHNYMGRKQHAGKQTPLAEFRNHLGLTLRELSERVNVPMPTISSAEYGHNGISRNLLDRFYAVFPEAAKQFFSDYDPLPPHGPQAVGIKAGNILDLETGAMNRIYHALKPLDEPARKRTLAWVAQRLADEEKHA